LTSGAVAEKNHDLSDVCGGIVYCEVQIAIQVKVGCRYAISTGGTVSGLSKRKPNLIANCR